MKKILVATALAGLSATSTLAAEMAVKAPVYAKAPMAAAFDWSGFYLGVNAGGGVGRSPTEIFSPGRYPLNDSTYLAPTGAVGGAQIGYNWQTRVPLFGAIVFGIEADIQGSNQSGAACIENCYASGFFTHSPDEKLKWFGTMRGRVGVATGPVLSYVTGGYAYGDVETSGKIAGGEGRGVLFSLSQNRSGWTLGGGVEASLGGNWTGKIEYLYLDLGTQSQTVSTVGYDAIIYGTPVTVSSRVRDNIFRGGINYAFNGNSSYRPAVANWTGFYIGGNVGALTANNRSNYSIDYLNPPNLSAFNLMPNGYQGGVQAGYNWQAASWVLGVEADFQGASSTDNKNCLLTCTPLFGTIIYDQKTPFVGTLRGRLGYSVGSTLFYGTAGFAYGQTKTSISANETNAPSSVMRVSHISGGYVAGAGIESPLQLFGLFGPAWTVKTEYLFVDLGRTTDIIVSPTFGGPRLLGKDIFATRTQEHIFRTGINYHFNAPVVATY